MNPFDEIAVEEAIKMREAGKVSEVVGIAFLYTRAVHVPGNMRILCWGNQTASGARAALALFARKGQTRVAVRARKQA